MNAKSLEERLEHRMNEVSATERARTILEDNPLQQTYIFDLKNDETIVLEVRSRSSSMSTAVRSEYTYSQYETIVIELTSEQFDELLSGELFSSLYLEGEITVKGLPPAWILLGNLFGINHDLQTQ